MMWRILTSISLLFLVGCTTAHDLGHGRYAVPREIEHRSPFGTNAGFVMIENCHGVPSESLPWAVNYSDCKPITKWKTVSSQGQGGQIAEGALVGMGFGLGSAFAATSSVTNTVSSSATSIARTGGRK